MVKRADPDWPIQDVLARRWSPYAFADRDVPVAELRSLFEAARWAPSSYNEQPWSYLVALRRDADAFERMLSCLVEFNRRWARHVPVLVLGVVRTRYETREGVNPAAEHDLGLAAGSLLVEATARGLMVHQMIGIEPERARAVFSIPDDWAPLTAIAIGYPGDPNTLPDALRERDLRPRTRKPQSAFVFAHRFGTPWSPEGDDRGADRGVRERTGGRSGS